MEALGSHADANNPVWEAGERIETLLNASSCNGVAARERAEELVRQVPLRYAEGRGQVGAPLITPSSSKVSCRAWHDCRIIYGFSYKGSVRAD